MESVEPGGNSQGPVSWECLHCGKPALSRLVTNRINNWMSCVIALFPDGRSSSGAFLKNGLIRNHIGYTDLRSESEVALYHQACYRCAGSPAYERASSPANDKGWFFAFGAYDSLEPRITGGANGNVAKLLGSA